MIARTSLVEQKVLKALSQIPKHEPPQPPPSSEAVVENSIMQWHCDLAREPSLSIRAAPTKHKKMALVAKRHPLFTRL